MSAMFSKIFSSKQGVDTSTADTGNKQVQGNQSANTGASGTGGNKNVMTGGDNQVVTSGNQQQQTTKAPQDPLAAFAKMFDNSSNDGEKKPPSYKLSPEVLKQAADSLDFSDTIPKDFQDRLAKNDHTVWADIVNGLGRKAYSHALEHNSVLTDRFVDQRSQFDRSGYGKEVTKHVARQSLKSIAEKSPTTAKFLEGIQNELLDKNPDATPDWLEEQSRKAIMSMAGIISPEDFVEHQKQTKQKDAAGGDTDWDNYFSKGK